MNDDKKSPGQTGTAGQVSLIERAAERLSRDFSGTGQGRCDEIPVEMVAPERPERTPPKSAPKTTKAEERAPAKRVDIDMARLAAMGMVTPDGMHTPIGEEFRVIKRPLLLKALVGSGAVSRNGNRIMVTSAVPNEGKTFTAVNLAMSMISERDVFVLLIDADLNNPSVSTTLGIETDKGFVDVLEDESVQISDVLLRTNIDNLSIIPAGQPHPMATELLASGRARNVVDEIAKRYSNRIIIFDTAPVLASSQGGAFCRNVDQVVLVVEAEHTNEANVHTTLGFLSSCENIGLVLNKVRTKIGSPRHVAYRGYNYNR